MRFANLPVQHFGCRLYVGYERLHEIMHRTDLLLSMGNSECFVERRLEAQFAAPPVVVIFLPFVAKEPPAIIYLPPRADDRHAGSFGDAPFPLFVVAQR